MQSPFAREVIERLQAVYAIEAEIRGSSAEQRLAVRRTRTAPLMKELKARLTSMLDQLFSQSSVAGSTAPVIRSRTPLANAISIVPPVPAHVGHTDGSGATETAANCTSLLCCGALTAPNDPVRARRRQTVSKLRCTSCRRATSTTLAEAVWLSSTIRSFSTVDHLRRRSGPDKIETLLTFAHLLANQSANYRRQSCCPEGGPYRTLPEGYRSSSAIARQTTSRSASMAAKPEAEAAKLRGPQFVGFRAVLDGFLVSRYELTRPLRRRAHASRP